MHIPVLLYTLYTCTHIAILIICYYYYYVQTSKIPQYMVPSVLIEAYNHTRYYYVTYTQYNCYYNSEMHTRLYNIDYRSRHPNLIHLIGYSHQPPLLMYPFMVNICLYHCLHKEQVGLLIRVMYACYLYSIL